MSLYRLVRKYVICRKCFQDVEAHEKCFLDENTAFKLLLHQDKSWRIQRIRVKIIETSNALHGFRVQALPNQEISPDVPPCTITGEWEERNRGCALWLQSVEAQPKAPSELEAAEQLEAQEFSEEARQAVMNYRNEVAAAIPEPKRKPFQYSNNIQKLPEPSKTDVKLGAQKLSGEVLSGSNKSAEQNASSSKRTSHNDKFSKAKETPGSSYTKILSRGEKLDECSKDIPENRDVPKEEIKQGVGKTYAEVLMEAKKSAE
ncbi:predicted protein [Sclerotinia sclerotiorum 1980 UF-70]|uniref:Uncharacterized protein n=2 Tax=Sclerotinia sclerotiorum (strain ATCC 18683 / 1980 / Ss-1) TaxID=665079 RepID=A7F1H0_SCLS1|nr:predicted protein [Sclerotinia sclerotiorum 1980 UF-70]APA11224.1 hypothetical protein sscle_07g059940 [Sclerotinia sclerotiorum 1980 UF-70]EDN95562.1 predicted protein [Sclerotinia sclerotiorum 1980 UF-70]